VTAPGAGSSAASASRPPAATDPLLRYRDEFPSLARVLHFISHSLGAMPRGVEAELARYARTWSERGIRAWEEEWFELPTRVGDAVGALFDAPPGTVSMTENVTIAQAVALSSIDFTPPRNRLVCTAEDFPSMLYLYEGLARRGVEIVRVPARDGRWIDERDLAAAIDERTAVVAASLVLFRTSQILDLAPVVRRAREAGAATLIDAYQAIGTVPVDVGALDADFLTGGSVKWLCGGPGAGYLHASTRARSRTTAFTGWMAHEDPFEFDSGPMRWHSGPRRFWTGTPGIPSFAAAVSGYRVVAAAGVDRIREKSLRQTERMLGWADEFGFPVVSPRDPAVRGGTVVLDVPNAERVCRALLAGDVLLDFRPGVGLRLAPHFYTRDDEIDQVMARVRDEVRKA
jgi:kynureninase